MRTRTYLALSHEPRLLHTADANKARAEGRSANYDAEARNNVSADVCTNPAGRDVVGDLHRQNARQGTRHWLRILPRISSRNISVAAMKESKIGSVLKLCGSGLLLAMLVQTPVMAGESISKVNGAVNAEAGKVYDELSTVNGSVNVSAGARTKEASAVNGSINLDNKAQADEVSTVNGAIDGQNDLVLGSVETVNGAVTLGQRATVNKYIESVNGAIRVDFLSQIKGDVSTVNGGITLRQTTMDGDIETVNGDITIGAKSLIKGGIKVKKPNNSGWNINWGKPRIPRIVIGPNAVVQGDIVLERKAELFVHASAKIGNVIGGTAVSYTEQIPARK